MRILKTREDLFQIDRSKSLGFVATMGALHDGHGALIGHSIRDNAETCVSIFVNPTQFNNPEDLKSYPNTLEKDLELCHSLGAGYVFVPEVSSLYQKDESITFEETTITEKYEGPFRPGHFNGVLLVVMKLLNLISPNRAYFGEKDYQQYLLIKSMVDQFFMNTKIVGVPTQRDEWGLALSSRNLNLSEKGLLRAREIAGAFLASSSKEDFLKKTENLEINLEYYGEDWGRALIAHYVEGVRLIDNKGLEDL